MRGCNPSAPKPSSAEETLGAVRYRLEEKACNLVNLNSGEQGRGSTAYEGLFRAQMQPVVPGGGGGEPASRAEPPSQVRDGTPSQDLCLG